MAIRPTSVFNRTSLLIAVASVSDQPLPADGSATSTFAINEVTGFVAETGDPDRHGSQVIVYQQAMRLGP